jgi:hypothetical protein
MSAEGKTLMSKQSEHKGFDMESAPADKELGPFINQAKKTKRTTVSKEGDKSALINKTTSDGFGAENDDSVISGKMGSKAR